MGEMWHDVSEKPDAGNRIVVLHGDGSGGFLAYWTGEEMIDHDGDDGSWRDEPGSLWAYLPDGFDLWCENRADDPFTLPANARTRP